LVTEIAGMALVEVVSFKEVTSSSRRLRGCHKDALAGGQQHG
jgi:hypothetical protein